MSCIMPFSARNFKEAAKPKERDIKAYLEQKKYNIMFLKRCLAHTAFYSRNQQDLWLTRPHESFQMAPVKPRTIDRLMF